MLVLSMMGIVPSKTKRGIRCRVTDVRTLFLFKQAKLQQELPFHKGGRLSPSTTIRSSCGLLTHDTQTTKGKLMRDILNVQLVKGTQVYFKPNRKIGIGVLTGESFRTGTAQVLRYSVVFPHSRTKTKTITLACEAESLEVIQGQADTPQPKVKTTCDPGL